MVKKETARGRFFSFLHQRPYRPNLLAILPSFILFPKFPKGSIDIFRVLGYYNCYNIVM